MGIWYSNFLTRNVSSLYIQTHDQMKNNKNWTTQCVVILKNILVDKERNVVYQPKLSICDIFSKSLRHIAFRVARQSEACFCSLTVNNKSSRVRVHVQLRSYRLCLYCFHRSPVGKFRVERTETHSPWNAYFIRSSQLWLVWQLCCVTPLHPAFDACQIVYNATQTNYYRNC